MTLGTRSGPGWRPIVITWSTNRGSCRTTYRFGIVTLWYGGVGTWHGNFWHPFVLDPSRYRRWLTCCNRQTCPGSNCIVTGFGMDYLVCFPYNSVQITLSRTLRNDACIFFLRHNNKHNKLLKLHLPHSSVLIECCHPFEISFFRSGFQGLCSILFSWLWDRKSRPGCFEEGWLYYCHQLNLEKHHQQAFVAQSCQYGLSKQRPRSSAI